MRLEDGGFRRHSRTPLVGPSIVREIPHAMGVHTVEERVVYAPTQWTVSCDASCSFGPVSSCYPLKCTVPSLRVNW